VPPFFPLQTLPPSTLHFSSKAQTPCGIIFLRTPHDSPRLKVQLSWFWEYLRCSPPSSQPPRLVFRLFRASKPAPLLFDLDTTFTPLGVPFFPSNSSDKYGLWSGPLSLSLTVFYQIFYRATVSLLKLSPPPIGSPPPPNDTEVA